jgi:DNA polymerase-3 subunit delta'
MTVWDRLHGSRAASGLEAQIASGEVAHAWLLTGPSGAGKTAAAVAMAAALECTAQPLIGCGECSSCLRTQRRRHPDVHHILAEGPLIPVDMIREAVIPEANRSPFEGAYKVFIIEEAERMNPAAQNALLKTLEEPQPGTIFILTSDRDEELLDTVQSRCRVVRLEPVPEERIVELLKHEGADDAEALVAARVSEGDMERARSLAFDSAVAERRTQWIRIPRRLASPSDALDVALEILSEAKEAAKEHEASQKEEVQELADALGERRGTAQARNALAKRHRRELRRLEEEVLAESLQTLGSFYRDVLAARRGDSGAVVNLDLLDEIRTWADSEVSDAGLVAAIARCVEARGGLPKNANPQLVLESALVALGRLAPPQARVGAR